MTDSQNERLYNLFNRVTVVTQDTYIDISTATNVMNCVEPALHCTDKQLIGALNEFNYPILDTLLGRHRLIGINIKPEYIQYMTELDKMYRKSNPSLVYNFLNKDQTLKGILDTHVVKAKSNKSVITKDQMIKMLSGYATSFYHLCLYKTPKPYLQAHQTKIHFHQIVWNRRSCLTASLHEYANDTNILDRQSSS